MTPVDPVPLVLQVGQTPAVKPNPSLKPYPKVVLKTLDPEKYNFWPPAGKTYKPGKL